MPTRGAVGRYREARVSLLSTQRLLQRAMHSEELGDEERARAGYLEVIALDGSSRAATLARQRLAALG